jgi:hypothetical protein
MKKVNSIWSIIRTKMFLLLSPEPEVESEYIDKMVFLLRRDFDTKTQNNIVLSIGKKLSELREQDMRKMEDDFRILQEDTASLQSKFAF